MRGILIGALLGLAFGCASAASFCHLKPFTARYNVYVHGDIVAHVAQQYQASKGSYQFTSTTKTALLFYHDTLIEKSNGFVRGNAFKADVHNMYNSRKNYRSKTSFLWKQREALYQVGSKKSRIHLFGLAYDGLNYQLMMRCDLFVPNVRRLSYTVIQNGRRRILHFLVTKTVLKTAQGALPALEATETDQTKTRIALWFAPSMHNLLVASETLKGNTVEALVKLNKL